MKMHTRLCATLCALFFAGCHAASGDPRVRPTGRNGALLLIGGGLDNDNAPVYRRFLALAQRANPDAGRLGPMVAIMTAATGPQDQEATDKTEALRCWQRDVRTAVVRRETDTVATVAAIDAASGLFFTGGDQKRITDRYRPEGQDTPEWRAMLRLLQRGGVIAGASAGDAMMGEFMFLGGGSARALGIAPASPPADAAPPELGPQLGAGMKFLPWALTDSHFFERDRIGRLVAGLEASGQRLGIGVGEDAAVEVDLATGELTGVSVSASLLVDAAHLQRDGAARRHLVARIVQQGDRISLVDQLAHRGAAPRQPKPSPHEYQVPIAEPGQNRQLAAWRLFHMVCGHDTGQLWRLQLDGWRIVAWAHAPGEAAFDLEIGP